MESRDSLWWWLQCAYSFSQSTKEVFNVQGAWHYPNTLPNNGQRSGSLTTLPNRERGLLLSAEPLGGVYPCELSPVPAGKPSMMISFLNRYLDVSCQNALLWKKSKDCKICYLVLILYLFNDDFQQPIEWFFSCLLSRFVSYLSQWRHF